MAEYAFREFQTNQQQTLNRAVTAYQDYLEALENRRAFNGGRHWKTIKGRQYLYQYRNRLGQGHSLGPRTPATERLLEEFRQQRRAAAARLHRRRQQLAEAARFCRAALIHRVPHPVVRILRHLDQGESGENPVMVVGTPALHAFEFAAGVFIAPPRTSPFWPGPGSGLTLVAEPDAPDRLWPRLRRADRSFQFLPGDGLAAVNKRGFLVRFLKPPAPRAPGKLFSSAGPETPVPDEAGDLAALVHSPKFSQVVIGARGDPVTMVVPDPRALALHKLWLSQQEGRPAAARRRDRTQALALAELILRYLPQYDFFSSQLNLFPAGLVRRAQASMEGYQLSPDLDLH